MKRNTSLLVGRVDFAVAIACASFVGGAWRAINVEGPALDHDEVYEVTHRTTDLATLVGRTDGFPPLYRWLVAHAIEWSGRDMAARWFSVVVGTATIPLAGLLGRRLAGPRAGFAAAALLAFSASHVQASQHARAYALVILLVAWALLAAWRLRGSDRVVDWASFLAASWLGLATHYYSAIATALLGGMLLVEKRGAARRRALAAAAAMAGAGATLLPALRADLADAGEFHHRVTFDVESYAFGYLSLATGGTLGPTVNELRELVGTGDRAGAIASAAPWAAAAFAPTALLLMAGWRSLRKGDRAWLAVLLVAPPLLLVAALPLTHTGYNHRYVGWMVVPLAVAAAAGFGAPAGPRLATRLAAAAAIVLGTVATSNRHHDPRYGDQDFHAVVELIDRTERAENADSAPAVVATPEYFGAAVLYTLPDVWRATVVSANPRTEQDWDRSLPAFAAEVAGRDGAWLVTPWFPPSHPQHALRERLVERLNATLEARVASTVMVYRFPTARLTARE